jgi:glycosyltransferase involved in cell wall biosynthesis
MAVRDELPFLIKNLPLIRKWATQIVVIDTGSIDGSVDYLMNELTDLDELIISDKQAVPYSGFSWARNIAAMAANCEWIHTLDADETLQFDQYEVIHDVLRNSKSDVVGITTVTFDRNIECGDTEWEQIAAQCSKHEDRHRRIYRANRGISWKGYIHEELYRGEQNCFGIHQDSPLRHLHFSAFRGWADPQVKSRRYAWMLLRAYRNPDLRKYTNAWWYTSYVPENLERLEVLAQEYVNNKYDFMEKE